MNKKKRLFSVVSGLLAIVFGLVVFVMMGFIFGIAKSCANASINGQQGSGLESKTSLLLSLYTFVPLIIAMNGVLLVNKKPCNKQYRLIIHITLIVLCSFISILSIIRIISSGDETYILFSFLIPAIFAFISLLIKEEQKKKES